MLNPQNHISYLLLILTYIIVTQLLSINSLVEHPWVNTAYLLLTKNKFGIILNVKAMFNYSMLQDEYSQ